MTASRASKLMEGCSSMALSSSRAISRAGKPANPSPVKTNGRGPAQSIEKIFSKVSKGESVILRRGTSHAVTR
jgi:hypothetical protein